MAYESVLECAVSQIGQKNDADGSNKYVEWYMGYRARGVAWCAIFISWCFKQVGILDRLDGLTNKAGCEPWRRWAVSKGLYGTSPRVGAIVLYDWNPKSGDGADHIGVVESIKSNGIVAIEGNTNASGSGNGGCVMRKTRYNSEIMGYVYVDTTAPVNRIKVFGEGFAKTQTPVYSGADPKTKTKITLKEGQKVYCYSTHNTAGVEYWHIDPWNKEWVPKNVLRNRKGYQKTVVFTFAYGTVNSKTGVRIHSAPGMKYTTEEVIAEGVRLYCYGTHNADGYEWWAVNASRTKWCRKTSLRDRVSEKRWHEIN